MSELAEPAAAGSPQAPDPGGTDADSSRVARGGTGSRLIWARIGGRAIKPWASLAARLVLAGVLGAAGLLKVVDPDASVRAVSAYRLLPYDIARLVGHGLPFIEIALAALLLLGLATRFAAMASAVFLLIFIASVSSAWARGLSIDCGCFGGGGQVASDETRYLQEIVRDMGLLALAAWLVVFPSSRLAVDG